MFVSGYTAAFVYGRQMRERGFVIAGAHILRRAWQIYVAHVFLFAIYLAEITYLMRQSSQALAASVLLYVLTWHFNWNLPSYPSGHWFFNPFAWQLSRWGEPSAFPPCWSHAPLWSLPQRISSSRF